MNDCLALQVVIINRKGIEMLGQKSKGSSSADQTIAGASCRVILEGDRVSPRFWHPPYRCRPGPLPYRHDDKGGYAGGFGVCHAGILFLLADIALPCACNGRNQRSVAHIAPSPYRVPGGRTNIRLQSRPSAPVPDASTSMRANFCRGRRSHRRVLRPFPRRQWTCA